MRLDVNACPLCSREVEAVQYVRHCNDPPVMSVAYIHANEKHFVFIEPRDEGSISLSRTLELFTE